MPKLRASIVAEPLYGAAAWKRRLPTGGAANGTPRKRCALADRLPEIASGPACTVTEPEPALVQSVARRVEHLTATMEREVSEKAEHDAAGLGGDGELAIQS